MEKILPSFDALKEISQRLKKAEIKHALGGSGMMAYFDLLDKVRDWDITTDAPLDKVLPLIKDLEFEHIKPSGIYHSAYLLKVTIKDVSIDIIGSFAIESGNGIFKVPTLVTAEWEGVPVGSPAVWAKAYQLMSRPEKAKLILDYISLSLKP